MTSTSHAELSPLAEIEQHVQAHAKQIALDLDAADSADQLHALIHQAVEAWSISYRRGERPFDLADPRTVAQRAWRNLTGYGPLEPLLADDDVWEIMVNAPDGTLRL